MEALHSIREALVALFEVLFETITRDNGTEFSRFPECDTTMAQRPDVQKLGCHAAQECFLSECHKIFIY